MTWNRNDPFNKNNKTSQTKINPKSEEFVHEKVYDQFMIDWKNCRNRHEGQMQVIDAFFEDGCKHIAIRAGRKFSKTTTDIDIAWRYAMQKPNRVIYFCYPSITQGIEVVWEEKRLQRCDLKDDSMKDKYIEKTDDSKHIVWFVNGSYMKLIGTWTEARGRGTQPDLLIVDELQDCSGEYLDAMDPNLAAKDGCCVMSGTPPRKRNHFSEWEERISLKPNGRIFKFTSYDNKSLPHLKDWLDRKRDELIKAGKEDEWLREYMAEDCYSNADRVLPDAKFISQEEMNQEYIQYDYKDRIPILAISAQGHYVCAIFAILVRRKGIFIMDFMKFPTIWNIALSEIYPKLGQKAKDLQDKCGKRLQNLVWDPTQSFVDVISGFYHCRKDIKWQERGVPLLREMMLNSKILINQNVGDLGLECQNLLRDETTKEMEERYPLICTLSMLVNEHFSLEKTLKPKIEQFDKWQAFRDMGIPYPKPKSKLKKLFSK